MSKRDTVEVFRQRLQALIERSGLSRAQFAARAGLDRSTLSQLLSEANVRLPRTETIARIAARHTVSIDWLLGLSQQDQVAADIVPHMAIEPDAASLADERLARWHEDARGYKVRYVPATLPDQIKTEAVITHETGRLNDAQARAWAGLARARIVHARRTEHEIEVCSPLQGIEGFARGEGMWRDLPRGDRLEQLDRAADLVDELYPAYRWFLFDGRERFSVPYTVFGPQRAAIYVGDMYFVFTSTEHIRELSHHFDNLIRSAHIQPNETAAFIRSLRKDV
ncbi:MAG: helix-turn-helix domain-containing protein [Parvibaculaceae bacterium]|jgi:transcriptional regulator with XRE-family HTH domain